MAREGRFGITEDTWRNWSAPAQAEVLRLLEAQEASQIWYCQNGRDCDGLPHEGAPYKHARGSQWPPRGHDWLTWLLSSGRGAGKTRTTAEYVRKMSDRCGRIALVGATGPDLRETMIEGESGLIYCCERAGTPGKWEPSRRRFTFANGAIATGFSSEEPGRLRGPQHHLAWADEPAHFDNIVETWDNLLLGLRLGRHPHVVATTTPVPSKWMKDTAADPLTKIVRESTYANLHNLAPTFKTVILGKYEGTRKGRQELHGEILPDVEGALWAEEHFHRAEHAPDLVKVIVGVDPAGTATSRSDETGIVVVGIDEDGNLWVLADYSGVYSPAGWAQAVADAYDAFSANVVVAENNYGGDLVKANLENAEQFMKVELVNSRHGKFIRAEPVHTLYEKGKVWHLDAGLDELETQMVEWVPGSGSSPDRLDALVHAVHELAGPVRMSDIGRATGRVAPRRGGRRKPVDYTGELADVVALHDPARRRAS